MFCLAIHPATAALIGLLLVFVWMLQIAPCYLGSLIAAGLQRKQCAIAKRAVTEGQISIGLTGRNRLCQGIVIADEARQQAFINGRIIPFGEIGSITVQTKRSYIYPFEEAWLDIMLRDAARTNLRVYFDDRVRADVFYRRLRGALGFV